MVNPQGVHLDRWVRVGEVRWGGKGRGGKMGGRGNRMGKPFLTNTYTTRNYNGGIQTFLKIIFAHTGTFYSK